MHHRRPTPTARRVEADTLPLDLGPDPWQTATTPLPAVAPTALPSATPPQVSTHPLAPTPIRRGQRFAAMTLIMTVSCAVFLGFGSYSALASVHLGMPGAIWSEVSDGVVLMVIGAVGLALAFPLAVIAVVRSRPKLISGLALLAHPGLVVSALVVGGWAGARALRQNLMTDLGPFAAIMRYVLGG